MILLMETWPKDPTNNSRVRPMESSSPPGASSLFWSTGPQHSFNLIFYPNEFAFRITGSRADCCNALRLCRRGANYYHDGPGRWLRLHQKGGKEQEMPAHRASPPGGGAEGVHRGAAGLKSGHLFLQSMTGRPEAGRETR